MQNLTLDAFPAHLLSESMWGDLQGSSCYLWRCRPGNAAFEERGQHKFLSWRSRRLERNLDCKKSVKAELKLDRISMRYPSEFHVQLLICNISCPASPVAGPQRGLVKKKNKKKIKMQAIRIHRIGTLWPPRCVGGSVRVSLCCGPHGHMAWRNARAETGLMNATQTQSRADQTLLKEPRGAAAQRLTHTERRNTQLSSCGHLY